MITLPASRLKDGAPDKADLDSLVRTFESGLPRLNQLARYFEGRHDILSRGRLHGLPNNRVPHAYPRYIAQVSAAYLLGDAVRVDGPEPAVQTLRGLLAHAAADAVDAQLALAQSIYGRAVSLCFEDEASRPLVCSLDPRSAFVVYDDTVARRALFGVHLQKGAYGSRVSVYTRDKVLLYMEGAKEPRQFAHPFHALPMAEFLNGADGHGDFEDVLALIDAYDRLQADRMNDREQFSDALLVLTGVMGIASDPNDHLGALERLRQEQTLALPDEHAKAEWLVKTPMEKDIDILRDALARDIHKFSLTPDFSDEHFAGNASGIAIKYKLFNFDNRIKLKERFFISGLRERARAFCGFMQTRHAVILDADLLSFKLARSLPVNELERAQALRYLKDIVPPVLSNHVRNFGEC